MSWWESAHKAIENTFHQSSLNRLGGGGGGGEVDGVVGAVQITCPHPLDVLLHAQHMSSYIILTSAIF